jgi:hypothetical protein
MSAQKPKISLITTFWGAWHTNAFLEYCLPSLLSVYNVPTLTKTCTVRMIIMTNEGNVERVKSARYFKEISAFIPIHIYPWPDSEMASFHSENGGEEAFSDDTFSGARLRIQFLMKCQNRILKLGFEDGFGIAYIHPDCLYANPIFEYVGKQARDGVDLIYSPAFRVVYENFKDTSFGANFTPSLTRFDPLVQATFDSMHKYHQHQFWDAKIFSRYPSCVFWKVRDDLVICREFHEKVPLYVCNEFSDIEIKAGLDADFDAVIFNRSIEQRGNSKSIKYLDDSRNGFICSFARKNYKLLDHWVFHGSLDEAVTSQPAPAPPERSDIYRRAFIMFASALNHFSARHITSIFLSAEAQPLPAQVKKINTEQFEEHYRPISGNKTLESIDVKVPKRNPISLSFEMNRLLDSFARRLPVGIRQRLGLIRRRLFN